MKSKKLTIKIIAYCIMIYSFYNLYSLKYLFTKDLFPRKKGNIEIPNYISPLDVQQSELQNVVVDNSLNFIEAGTSYRYQPNQSTAAGAAQGSFYVSGGQTPTSIIYWSDVAKRWIKAGDLISFSATDGSDVIYNEVVNKYRYLGVTTLVVGGGKNLGCVSGNNQNNVTQCKTWKENFGIGNQKSIAVNVTYNVDAVDLITRQSSEKNIKTIIPFIILFLVICFIIIIFIFIRLKK